VQRDAVHILGDDNGGRLQTGLRRQRARIGVVDHVQDRRQMRVTDADNPFEAGHACGAQSGSDDGAARLFVDGKPADRLGSGLQAPGKPIVPSQRGLWGLHYPDAPFSGPV
jgi:hypothetical protein